MYDIPIDKSNVEFLALFGMTESPKAVESGIVTATPCILGGSDRTRTPANKNN